MIRDDNANKNPTQPIFIFFLAPSLDNLSLSPSAPLQGNGGLVWEQGFNSQPNSRLFSQPISG
jgi:hypothetical protein